MISKYDVKQALEKYRDEIEYRYDQTTDSIFDQSGNLVCTMEEYVRFLRRKLHCDFETVFCCHGTLDDVYRCKECGTVIFGGDDEERYDPNCRCPVCCQDDSVCRNEYWSGADIAADPEKQETIRIYEEMYREANERQLRINRRNGLRDWEIWKKRLRFKSFMLDFALECDDLFHSGLKGLRFVWNDWKRDQDSESYIWKKKGTIPLSVSAAVLYWWKIPRCRKEKKQREKEAVEA